MNKQRIAGCLAGLAYGSTGFGLFFGLFDHPIAWWLLALAVVLVVVAECVLSTQPKFFVPWGHSGNYVEHNFPVLDKLTPAAVAHLSAPEREFFNMYLKG